MNILFLCTANLHRSRTAEFYFQKQWPKHCVRSAGLSEKECSRNQGRLCTPELIAWADKVFVMESHHLDRIEQNIGKSHNSKIAVLDIADIYQFMQKALIEELIRKVESACIAVPDLKQGLKSNWDSWFNGECVSNDFLADRGQ